jgi:hypothetical protein
LFAAETSYNLFTAWCTVTKVLSNFSFRLFLKLPLVGRLIFEDILTDDVEWGSLFVPFSDVISLTSVGVSM